MRRTYNLVELAQAIESQEARLAEEIAHLEGLREQLRAAASNGISVATGRRGGAAAAPAQNGAPIAKKTRSKRFHGSAEYWDAARERLLKAMKAGKLYTGAELEQLAATDGTSATFIRQVRDVLLADKKLKKVTEEGKLWKEGMFPGDTRWVVR